MAAKALNFKMDEAEIMDMKKVAGVFHMSVTDLVKNAVKEYVTELKKDPYYRLTANMQDASAEESEEILSAIEGLSDDDLAIVSAKRFTVSAEK
jgi:NACalpha-BTF3-like transcription factor